MLSYDSWVVQPWLKDLIFGAREGGLGVNVFGLKAIGFKHVDVHVTFLFVGASKPKRRQRIASPIE